MRAQVSLDDLENALLWASSPPEFDARAYVSRTIGKVYTRGGDDPVEEDLPPDIEDEDEYIAFPSKNELGFGRGLVFRFIHEFAPQAVADVHAAFDRKGAYGRFKSLLDRLGLLDAWHQYESEATVVARETWAQEHGFEVIRSDRHAPRNT